MHIYVLVLTILSILTSLVPRALLLPRSEPVPSWHVNVIQAAGDVGQYAAIAASESTTYISYYEATEHDLWIAYNTATNGNCGPQHRWQCEPVDSAGDVGQFSAMAINLRTNTPAIAYRDATNGDLKYATAQCRNTPPVGCTWISRVVDDGGANNADEGQYISLAIDPRGRPHIAYYEAAPPDPDCETLCTPFGSVKHTTPVASGGNCGGGNWQCMIVDGFIGTGMGQYASLALGSNGRPAIAYYDAGRLRLAVYVGSNGSCPYNEAWNCDLIDGGNATGGAGIGKYAALAIDPATPGRYHIAYYDEVNQTLKYATNNGSNTCRISGWSCNTIDTVGMLTAPRNFSIVSYATQPQIAYYSRHNDNGMLRLAQIEGASGNCGEQHTWRCTTIDSGGTHDVGQFAALARTGSSPAIAYYDATPGDLRLATTRYQQFFPRISNE